MPRASKEDRDLVLANAHVLVSLVRLMSDEEDERFATALTYSEKAAGLDGAINTSMHVCAHHGFRGAIEYVEEFTKEVKNV